ncbi:MAG: BamA/TamA family outer membrane protein [Chitinophagales bacterium]
MTKLKLLCITGIFSSILVHAQDTSFHEKPEFHQLDLKDWLVQKGWIKPRPQKNHFLLIMPIVATNPTAGFIYGAGLSYALKADTMSSRVSSASASATYSTNHLLNLNFKSYAFALKDKLVLNGDWRYLVNYEDTYGLGTQRKENPSGQVDLNGYPASEDPLSQSLKYDQVRIHETISYALLKNIYAGLGFQYDYFYNIQDNTLNTGDSASALHYSYSIAHGFNPKKYSISGLSINFLLDSRDNAVNAYQGFYANINYRVNLTAFGSTKNSTMLLTEYRSFHPLDGAAQRHILAFWFYGGFVVSGELPYLLLPAVGYDLRQRTGRGYTFGRFRGENMLYQETEYRFPISPRTGILGGVLFLNFTSTSDKANHVDLLDYVRIGWGGGMRIMLDKKSRTRLEVDIGVGEKKTGFYLGAQEAF